MNSTVKQNYFQSTLAVWLVLLLLCYCPSDANAQQTASPTPPSTAQNPPSSGAAAPAPEKEDAAAKDAAENPVAAAISLPLQNNTYYGVGPYRRAENALLIEPVVPIRRAFSTNIFSVLILQGRPDNTCSAGSAASFAAISLPCKTIRTMESALIVVLRMLS